MDSTSIFCIIKEDGVTEYFKVIGFISVAQFHPHPARAVCVDMHGMVSTPSIKQITVVREQDIPEQYRNTVIDL